LGTQEQYGRGFYEKIRDSQVGLLRVTRKHDVSHTKRETDEEMEPGVEAGTDLIEMKNPHWSDLWEGII
jgi:hypothetical protein